MINTEMGFTAQQRANIMMMEKVNQDNKRKPERADPGKIEEKLPIIDAGKKPATKNTGNKEAFNDADVKAEADDLDSGKNYTAAENDHDTNSTL